MSILKPTLCSDFLMGLATAWGNKPYAFDGATAGDWSSAASGSIRAERGLGSMFQGIELHAFAAGGVGGVLKINAQVLSRKSNTEAYSELVWFISLDDGVNWTKGGGLDFESSEKQTCSFPLPAAQASGLVRVRVFNTMDAPDVADGHIQSAVYDCWIELGSGGGAGSVGRGKKPACNAC